VQTCASSAGSRGRTSSSSRQGIESASRSPSSEDAQRVVANKPDLIFTVVNQLCARCSTRNGINSNRDADFWIPGRGLARLTASPSPEGMSTGNTIYAETGVWGKLLQLLREGQTGQSSDVGILWTYVIPAFPKEEIEPGYAELNSAARSLNLELTSSRSRTPIRYRLRSPRSPKWKPEGLLLTSFLNNKARVGRGAVFRGQRPAHDRRF